MSDFNNDRFEKLIAIAENRGLDIQYCEDYCEPGYTLDGDGPLLLADWNNRSRWNPETNESDIIDDSPERLCNLFEKLGCTIDWSDEYLTCGGCYNAFRCSGDSYGWKQYGWISEYGECQCGNCVKDDPADYLEELEGNSSKALTIDIDLEEANYVCVNSLEDGTIESFENGWHGGQCDDPSKVADSLSKQGIERYIFQIDSAGQFDIDFSVWIHRSELQLDDYDSEIDDWDAVFERITIVKNALVSSGPDPAIVLKAALQSASLQSAGLRAEQNQSGGVIYSDCKSDGTAETRLVSPDEFINGIE